MKEILRIGNEIKDGEIKMTDFSLSTAWYLFKKTLIAKIKGNSIKFFAIEYGGKDRYSIVFLRKLKAGDIVWVDFDCPSHVKVKILTMNPPYFIYTLIGFIETGDKMGWIMTNRLKRVD